MCDSECPYVVFESLKSLVLEILQNTSTLKYSKNTLRALRFGEIPSCSSLHAPTRECVPTTFYDGTWCSITFLLMTSCAQLYHSLMEYYSIIFSNINTRTPRSNTGTCQDDLACWDDEWQDCNGGCTQFQSYHSLQHVLGCSEVLEHQIFRALTHIAQTQNKSTFEHQHSNTNARTQVNLAQ